MFLRYVGTDVLDWTTSHPTRHNLRDKLRKFLKSCMSIYGLFNDAVSSSRLHSVE
jgi:hypothetical protein